MFVSESREAINIASCLEVSLFLLGLPSIFSIAALSSTCISASSFPPSLLPCRPFDKFPPWAGPFMGCKLTMCVLNELNVENVDGHPSWLHTKWRFFISNKACAICKWLFCLTCWNSLFGYIQIIYFEGTCTHSVCRSVDACLSALCIEKTKTKITIKYLVRLEPRYPKIKGGALELYFNVKNSMLSSFWRSYTCI